MPYQHRPPPSALPALSRAAQSRREQLIRAGPPLALGLVLLALWGLVAWYAWVYRDDLLQEQARALRDKASLAAQQTDNVLRDAQHALSTVDLWLLTRGRGTPLQDASLVQLVESLRDGSRGLVDVMLGTADGALLRIPSVQTQAHEQIGRADFVELLREPGAEGPVLGRPLQLPGSSAPKLPLAMRLSAPEQGLVLVVALIDLERLAGLQQALVREHEGSVVLMRGDGLALARLPALPGFAGLDLYAGHPERRALLSPAQGEFRSSGGASDGRERLVAFATLQPLGVKVLVSQTMDSVMARYLRQRNAMLFISVLVSAAALLASAWLARLQRHARLHDAALQATSEASPLGLFRSDAQGRLIYANQAYLRLHEFDESQIGWGWLTLQPEDQRERLRSDWQKAVARGATLDLSYTLYLPDGRQRRLALRTAPLRVGGRLMGLAGTVEDITEREAQRQAERTLHAILEQMPDHVVQIDLQGELLYLNPSARRRLGLAPEAPLQGMNMLRYFSPERLQRYREEILPTALREGHWEGRTQLQLGPDDALPADATVLVHRGARGQIETISVILRDISAELRAQREHARDEAMLRAMAETAPAMISVLDAQQRFLFFNKAYGQRFGIELADWRGRALLDLLGPVDHARSQPLIASALQGQPAHLEKHYDEGRPEPLVVDVHYAPLRVGSGQIEGVICIARDISRFKREEARLRDASQTDTLTQLLNRAGFELRADEQLALARQTQQWLALLYLDLDHFKPVNDRHGHTVGDALLRAVAGRLRHALRPQDLVARLGGDEFVVLLPSLHGAADAEAVAAKLVRSLSEPFMIETHELRIGASVGYCVSRGGALELPQLVARADAQLYAAKRAGRGRWSGETQLSAAAPDA